MYINFRIDWGYQYLYSRRHYHPFFHWDGFLECENGSITKTFQLDYPVIWYGPGHCAHETLLPGNFWQSTTRRGMAGVRIEANVEENAVFHLHTLSGNFDFSARDIIEKGRIVFPVGPKYLNCAVTVTRTGYYWFQRPALPGETLWEADDFQGILPVHDWSRMRTAWIAPGEKLSFEYTVPESKYDFTETLFHAVCMIAPQYTPGNEKQAADFVPVKIYCDGKVVAENTRFYRHHDTFMQMLEDLYLRLDVTSGKHIFELENLHSEYHFLINRISMRQCGYNHLQFSLPRWALTNEEQIGRIFAVKNESVTIQYPNGSSTLQLEKGWNEFRFTLDSAGKNVVFSSGNTQGEIEEVYDLANEIPEVTVGFDMTTVPHDASGDMDWLLDYTWRTQLGNIVVFRGFLYEKGCRKYRPVRGDLLYKWGDFCRRHGIYVEAATDFDDGNLIKVYHKFI